MNRAPSVKRLLEAFRDLTPENAEKIRQIIKGTLNPLDFRAAEEADRTSHGGHTKVYLKMLAIDELLENHGVESVRIKGVGRVDYSNSGDCYNPTIAYCNGIFMLTTLGDLVEKYGEDESSPF